MGALAGNLTNAMPSIGGQMFPSGQQAALAGSAQLPSADAMMGPDVLNPKMDTSAMPAMIKPKTPSFKEASNSGPGGTPSAMSPALSTKGKLLTVLLNAAKGAGAGAGSQTFGQGFAQGGELPFLQAARKQEARHGELENQSLEQQVQYAPLLRQLGIMKSKADISKTEADTGKAQADTSKAQAETGAIPAKQALEAAQAEAANYKDDPNVGLIDLRTKQPVNGQGFVPLSPEEAQILGKQPGERVPLKVKNTASEMVNRGFSTVNTEQGVYERNRGTGKMTRLGDNPRNIFAPENRIVPAAADPSNPGDMTYMKAGDAMKKGALAPQSAEHQAANAVAKSATSGKIGEEVNAFNTALAHADLLKKAATALKNGDVRSINSIQNAFSKEFGGTKITNFQVIANAYSREVTKMLSSGHMTDSEIGTSGATLPSNASLDQTLGAIDSYKALASSKMEQRKNQVKQGMQGKANFPDAASPSASDPLGIR